MRTRSDRLVAVATLGAFVVITGVLGLVSLYLGAVTQALSGLQRTSTLPEYEGRPDASPADRPSPDRFAVFVTGADGSLSSAYLAQLSASRGALHLIGLPSNLLIRQSTSESTLAHAFSTSPQQAVRAMETLLTQRLDHMVVLQMDGFADVVDVVGGVTVRNRHETAAAGWHFNDGDLVLNGKEARVYVGSPTHAMSRLERTEAVLVEILRGVVSGDTLTNPAKVDSLGEVLRGCVIVDGALTPAEIRRMALDVNVGPGAIRGTAVPLAGESTLRGEAVSVLDQDALPILIEALANDKVAEWVSGRPNPWAPLKQLPPR